MKLSQRQSIVASRWGLLIPRSPIGSVASTNLYGQKQAPRARYSWFAMYLLILGFVDAKFDTSLFIFRRNSDTVYLLLYVDDIMLITSSTALLLHTISTQAEILHVGPQPSLPFFGGLHIASD
jgi:hypothetical protein